MCSSDVLSVLDVTVVDVLDVFSVMVFDVACVPRVLWMWGVYWVWWMCSS